MPNRIQLFGIDIDPLRMPQAVERVMGWLAASVDRSAGCRYIVTPNCDHVVLLEEHEGLRAAYRGADLVLVDGMPVVWASRLLKKPVPERVTGADLVPALFDAARADRPLTTYLLGALPGVAERAAAAVEAKWPHVRVVGTYSPPLGFERDEAENEAILGRVAAVNPDLLVVGLGAPKQECWVHAHRDRIRAGVALCVGATIDFLAGEKSRAPVWMRRSGLEWLHRVLTEPRRLARRYARDARIFPRLVWREWRMTPTRG
ncbi:MAG TPA: WecB/TagA/CpsF family glycosyltransferase [Planctomycetaceae bacterium]|nr:WecB/TagA/CpsF family glycosyltransferase [Planctomycetaceae bacterium]